VQASGTGSEVYVSPWWQASILPSRWDVCGYILPALSVWHLWVLENTPPGIGSPYLTGELLPDLDDAAALICVARHTKAQWTDGVQWDAGRRRALARDIHRRLRRIGEAAALGTVADYAFNCMRVPAHDYPKNAKVKGVRGPWQWHLVVAISGGDPARMEAAWDMPFAAARCTADILRERLPGGDESLADARRQRTIDEWAARKAAGKVAS